ncbi:MAG: response regulator [Anaerolineae bacterium]|nr:response regulator [Anaerolineae bacterium]
METNAGASINTEPAILYVDDEPLSRQVMQMLLELQLRYKNYTILEDSSEFITRLQGISPQPNIIFLDIHMKPHNGFEVLSMLRKHEGYQDVKVVACTASVMNEEIHLLQRADFDGCIGKPIDTEYFPEFVSRVLKGEQVWHIA